MKKFNIYTWCPLVILTLLSDILCAQTQFKFENRDVRNGLSNNNVYSIAQDDLGFIWIATDNGLNRYDGSSFKIYKNDPEIPESLSFNKTSRVYKDNKGDIWVSFTGVGVDRYNVRYDNFDHFSFYDSAKNRQPISVRFFFERSNGDFILGGESGMFLLKEKSRIFVDFFEYYGLKKPEGTIMYNHMVEDSKGIIWVASNQDVFRYDLD